jgi:hypothetical protein
MYTSGQERRGALAAVGAYGIVFLHLIVSPLSLPGQCWTIARVSAMLEGADRGVPATDGIRERTVIFLNTPQDTYAIFSPAMRAVQGIPRPRSQRWLATGLTAIDVKRIDAFTLEVQPESGFVHEHTEKVARSRRRPFFVGDQVRLSDLTVDIREVTDDGRPKRARFRFTRPLEDPSYLWLVWRDQGYAPFRLPAIGASVTITKTDFVGLLFGAGSPVARLFAHIRRLQKTN